MLLEMVDRALDVLDQQAAMSRLTPWRIMTRMTEMSLASPVRAKAGTCQPRCSSRSDRSYSV